MEHLRTFQVIPAGVSPRASGARTSFVGFIKKLQLTIKTINKILLLGEDGRVDEDPRVDGTEILWYIS